MKGPLLLISGAPEERDAGIALARHVETLLFAAPRAWGGIEIREVPPGLPPALELLAATAASGSLPYPVVSLDLTAAAALAHARQHLLLRDSAARLEALFGAPDGAEAALGLLRLLRGAASLVVFSGAAAERLGELGCQVGAVVPRLALAPPATIASAATEPRCLIVVNHLGRPEAALPAVAQLRRLTGGLQLVGTSLAPAEGVDLTLPWLAPPPGEVLAHVHLGLPQAADGAPRLVDSFACRKPVLLHLPLTLPAPAAAPLIHEVEGLVTTRDLDLTAALSTLISDRVFGDILVRNAERRAHGFNREAAQALAAAVPDLFA